MTGRGGPAVNAWWKPAKARARLRRAPRARKPYYGLPRQACVGRNGQRFVLQAEAGPRCGSRPRPAGAGLARKPYYGLSPPPKPRHRPTLPHRTGPFLAHARLKGARRHGPWSGSVRAASVTRWRQSARAIRRVGQRSTRTRGQWARSRDNRARPSESSRPSHGLSARPSVPSVNRQAVGVLTAHAALWRSLRRCGRGTDSDGALTDPGAMGY